MYQAMKLTLAAAATFAVTISLASNAHADDSQYANFLSPSGNINCSIMLLPPFPLDDVQQSGNNTVNCELTDHVWTPPGKCPTGIVGTDFRADATTPPTVHCEKYPNQLPLPWPTLEYGQKVSLGVISCDSEADGVTCTNSDTGHFFRVSRDSYLVG
jgi:hypothetical protein